MSVFDSRAEDESMRADQREGSAPGHLDQAQATDDELRDELRRLSRQGAGSDVGVSGRMRAIEREILRRYERSGSF